MGAGGGGSRARSARAAIEAGAPLIFEVGHLGRAYNSWVNAAVPGQPRFFASDTAEAVTKCPWWAVPLIWLPVWALCASRAFRLLDGGGGGGGDAGWAAAGLGPHGALLAWTAAGALSWQVMEYSVHRFVFHGPYSSYWGLTFHLWWQPCTRKWKVRPQ